MTLEVIILAAGKGKRMRSALPKVLHPLAGKPLLQHVVETAQQLQPAAIHAVIGHEKAQIQAQLGHLAVNWVEQAQQMGTGDAVAAALPFVQADAQVLILFGDVPLVSAATLRELIAGTRAQGLGIVTAKVASPYGLGRIIRNHQRQITRIVEHADASPEQLAIDEINSGIMLTSAANLRRWLPRVSNQNAQQEYYLPDIIPFAVMEGCPIAGVLAETEIEVQGVNDRAQLIQLERCYQQRLARHYLLAGVTILDPARFDLRGTLEAGTDVVIDINTVMEGKVVIGSGSRIGPNCLLRNVVIGENVCIEANTVLDGAEIGDGCKIGPYARVRPGTRLAAQVHLGNFVEVKNARLGVGSKANHLSYIGDADIGERVNMGAGTITCNYDGVNKHQTIIEDEVFVGSGTQLVAPVRIKKQATIGAGSTITKEAPAATLTLSRSQQVSVPGWRRPAADKINEEV